MAGGWLQSALALPKSLATFRRAASTKMRHQFLLQHSTGLYEEAAIDRLVRHLHALSIGVFSSQPSSDLLRRPLQRQLLSHKPGQLRIERQGTGLRSARLLPGPPIGQCCTISLGTAIAMDLSANR